MKYIAVIPCYEPNINLIELVKELKKNKFDIIIVNDGSDKVYNSIFNKCKSECKIISYKYNKGKGFALKKAFSFIKDNYKDGIIVTVDCDGQHKVFDAVKLCNYVKNKKNIICLGKRDRSGKIPFKSKIGNEFIRYVFHKKMGVDIYDTQTGLRAFDISLIDFMIKINGDRYEYEMSMLINAVKNNINIKEIEIDTIYENNNKGSHFKVFSDSLKIIKIINERK